MATSAPTASDSRGIRYAVGLGVLWLVLAFMSPNTTFHLAPFLVAAAAPVVTAMDDGSPGDVRLVLSGLLGMAVAMLATLVLAVSANLAGPSLLPAGGAVLESVVFAVVGAVVGTLAGMVLARR